MQGLKGVLLDVDGTLVDSNDAHTRAWVRALAENGITVSFEKVRLLIGKGGDKLLPEVAGIDADSPKGKTISERRGEIFVIAVYDRPADLLLTVRGVAVCPLN
jgi:beta-phosphoglucomutase-like phosphatase (HAD superfamily)